MSDLVKRLRGLYDDWNSPHSSPDGLPTGASVMLEAADRIEQLEAEQLEHLGQIKQMSEKLDQLLAEVQTWQGHAKTAIWSDSEECKVLTAEVERLLKSRNRWAAKYNDLLAKRRAEDGYDVYAAAREEYRKKISEQADRIAQLEAALRGVMVGGNHLVSIIGVPHPAAGMTHEYVLAHYGPGHQYDAWCCWNAIMEARAALGEERT